MEIPTTKLRPQIVQQNLELLATHYHGPMRRIAPVIAGIATAFEESALARGMEREWLAFHEIGKHKNLYNKAVEEIVGKGWDEEEKAEVRDKLAGRHGFEGWKKMETYLLLVQFNKQILNPAEAEEDGLFALQQYAYGIDEKGKRSPNLDPMLEMPYSYLKEQIRRGGPYRYAHEIMGRIEKYKLAKRPARGEDGIVLTGNELGYFLHDMHVLREARTLAIPGGAKEALLDNLRNQRWKDAPTDPCAPVLEVDRIAMAKGLIAKLWKAGLGAGLTKDQSTDYAIVSAGLIEAVERLLRDIDPRHIFIAADFSGLIADVLGTKALGKGKKIDESDIAAYDALNEMKWKIVLASYTPHIGIGALPYDVIDGIRRLGRTRALYPDEPERVTGDLWRTEKHDLRLEHYPWLAAKMLDSIFIRRGVNVLSKTHVPVTVALQSQEGIHGYPYGSSKKDVCADIVGIAKCLSMLIVPDALGISHDLNAALLTLDGMRERPFNGYVVNLVIDALLNSGNMRKRAEGIIAFYGL